MWRGANRSVTRCSRTSNSLARSRRAGTTNRSPGRVAVRPSHTMSSRCDLLDLGEELNYLSKNDGWGEMASRISDDVVRQFAAVGRHDEIAAAIEDRYGGLTDAIGASASPEIPADLPQEVIQDIQKISTFYNESPSSTI